MEILDFLVNTVTNKVNRCFFHPSVNLRIHTCHVNLISSRQYKFFHRYNPNGAFGNAALIGWAAFILTAIPYVIGVW